jgi:hypothetical protein
MDEFGAPDSLTKPPFRNVSISVWKAIPNFLWSKSWPYSSNELNVRAELPPN